ncbi:MAG: hypothetical protein ACLQD9_07790 [Thermoplasmata archaeon]|nr:hypothetical protein [Thermoplasmata archaeon]
MNLPFHWGLIVLAVAATAGSIFARTELTASVPLAAMAVVAAGLALWDGVRQAPHAAPTRLAAPEVSAGDVRLLFREGRIGREGILFRLDALERRTLRPDLPVRPPAEIRAFSNLPDVEFRRRVASRLDGLEKAP